jgi:hypothetical protein
MSDPIPSIPTPPLPNRSRSIVYAVWAWSYVLILSVVGGWAFLGNVPEEILAVSVGWGIFGGYAGFMAKNNVR